METYERLICDLGHRLLTKGLNNDFTESGSVLGAGVMCTGAGHKEPTANNGAQKNSE